MEPISTEPIHRFTLRVELDPEPMDPRDADHLGRMLCFHRYYDLGDPHSYDDVAKDQEADEVRRYLMDEEGASVALPLYLLDHSGLSLSAGRSSDKGDSRADAFMCDPGGWDTSHVGWIMDSETTRERLGMQDASPEVIEEALRAEVEEYDAFLRGLVYGFVLLAFVDSRRTDFEGEPVESCWGFYSEDDARNEGRATADAINDARRLRFEEILDSFHGNLTDPDSVQDLVDADSIPRYLLVEQSTHDGTYYLSWHDTMNEAAREHDRSVYPEDYSIRSLVDLDTGHEYYAQPTTTFHRLERVGA